MNETDKTSTAVLLINTGSPDNPNPIRVAQYLSKFLGDHRIISIPWLFRKLLVNCVIVPFRCFLSGARYRKLWNSFGGKFPLPYYGLATQNLLQEKLKDKATVFLSMRYGKPSIQSQIKIIAAKGYEKLIVLPMFPQYASSSTGSAIEKTLNELKKQPLIPEIKVIRSFYDHPAFIDAFAEKIRMAQPENYEQILFTYHSLPLSHVRIASATKSDYETACNQTTAFIAKALGLPEHRFETTYQSQMSDKWLKPFINQVIAEKGKSGVKRLMVVAPSFVADCLESSLELGEEYKQLFFNNGGEKYHLVESLNDSPLWIEALRQIIVKEL